MKLIIGLGNPGDQYAHTRHNIGFDVLDIFAEEQQLTWSKQHQALVASGQLEQKKFTLAKPQTYMNLSGISASQMLRWHKISPQDIIVICDDLDLPPGQIRIRRNGGTGGHNGLSSLVEHLHSNEFCRVRIGIGRPQNGKIGVTNYVLGRPDGEDAEKIRDAITRAADSLKVILTSGLGVAMNQFNISSPTTK